MPSASPEHVASVLKITSQFLIAVWAPPSMSIFQGYQNSRRTIRTHFCAEPVFFHCSFLSNFTRNSAPHFAYIWLVMAIICCKSHWEWPCNRSDASTSQEMQRIARKHQKLKEERNRSLHLGASQKAQSVRFYFRVLASRIVRHCFKPPCLWCFVMAAIGNWYSKLFDFYLTSSLYLKSRNVFILKAGSNILN